MLLLGSYIFRSILSRRRTTFATVFGIALVVLVLASVMMLLKGIERSLVVDARPDRVVVLGQGATSELASNFDATAARLVLDKVEVKRDGVEPRGSGEVVIVAALPKVNSSAASNVGFRGVTAGSFKLRPSFHLVQGAAAKPGTDEVVMGRRLVGNFRGLALGESYELRRGRSVRVVGVFEDGGSSNESEVWGDIDALRGAIGREGSVSSVRAELVSAAAFDAFKESVERDKRLGLKVWRETDYVSKLSAGVAPLVGGIGGAISFFLALGAVLGAMITMYSAVSDRTREIGTLRALGFSRFTILSACVFEAILLTLTGGIIGALGSLLMAFVKFSIVTQPNWSVVVFSFQPTPGVIVRALLFAVIMGLFGGLLPAIRASRIHPAAAMRAR